MGNICKMLSKLKTMLLFLSVLGQCRGKPKAKADPKKYLVEFPDAVIGHADEKKDEIGRTNIDYSAVGTKWGNWVEESEEEYDSSRGITKEDKHKRVVTDKKKVQEMVDDLIKKDRMVKDLLGEDDYSEKWIEYETLDENDERLKKDMTIENTVII